MIIKLTALGDVATTTQLLYGAALANPQDSFTLLTQPYLSGLLFDAPPNVESMVMDIKREERSLWGVLKYVHRLKRECFNVVIDFQRTWRTRLICLLLRLVGVRTMCIPASMPNEQAAQPNANLRIEQIRQAFAHLISRVGLQPPQTSLAFSVGTDVVSALKQIFTSYHEFETRPWIGVAPFPIPRDRAYSPQLMEQLVAQLSQSDQCLVLLFGRAKDKEADMLSDWAARYPHVLSLVGLFDIADELAILQHLRLFICTGLTLPRLTAVMGTNTLTLQYQPYLPGGFAGYKLELEDHDDELKTIDKRYLNRHLPFKNCADLGPAVKLFTLEDILGLVCPIINYKE